MPIHRSGAFLIIALSLALAGCLPAIPTPLTEAQMQTRIALGVVAGSGTPSPVGISLPPTWTLTPTPVSEATPTGTPIPTSPPPTPVVSITPASFASPTPEGTFTLSGAGHFKTETFSLPAGKVLVTWKYAGYNDEMTQIARAQKQFEDKLATLDEWRKFSSNFFEESLSVARRRHDQQGMAEAQAALKKIDADYRTMVKSEEKGYQSRQGLYSTRFVLTINRLSADAPRLIASGAGGTEGTVEYEAKEAADYYFTIRAPGDWTIQVTAANLE